MILSGVRLGSVWAWTAMTCPHTECLYSGPAAVCFCLVVHAPKSSCRNHCVKEWVISSGICSVKFEGRFLQGMKLSNTLIAETQNNTSMPTANCSMKSQPEQLFSVSHNSWMLFVFFQKMDFFFFLRLPWHPHPAPCNLKTHFRPSLIQMNALGTAFYENIENLPAQFFNCKVSCFTQMPLTPCLEVFVLVFGPVI